MTGPSLKVMVMDDQIGFALDVGYTNIPASHLRRDVVNSHHDETVAAVENIGPHVFWRAKLFIRMMVARSQKNATTISIRI